MAVPKTPWRPSQRIRVIAIGIVRRGDAILAAEVFDDAGHLKGVRPLGGAVEFGESWQDALIREFHEELGLLAKIASAPVVLENLYRHEGQTGHEIVFAAEVTFPAGKIYQQEVITFAEDNGVICTARWFDLNMLDETGPALFPEGLKPLLMPD